VVHTHWQDGFGGAEHDWCTPVVGTGGVLGGDRDNKDVSVTCEGPKVASKNIRKKY